MDDSNDEDRDLLDLVVAAFADVEVPDSVQASGRSAFAAIAGPSAAVSRARSSPLVQHRLERHLAAAASGGARVLEGTFSGSDPQLVTSVRETPDGHLLATITSADPHPDFAVLSWSFVDEQGVGETRRLATPLAPGRDSWSAQYDLGSVLSAAAVVITPAETVGVDDVRSDEVQSARDSVLHGSARRAWSRALARSDVPAWMRELMSGQLE